MTTASLRTTVKQRLVDVFTAALTSTGVQVSYGPFRAPGPREGVVLHWMPGNRDQPSAETGAAARKPSFDDFTIEGVIGAKQIGQTAYAAERRAEQIYDLLKNATIDPAVAGPNLYGGGAYTPITGLLWVWMRPGDLMSNGTEQGFDASFEFQVDVRTRLT